MLGRDVKRITMEKAGSSQPHSQHSLIRTFIAVSLPDAAAKELELFLNSLKPQAHLRWVKASQMHITLRFLGEQTWEMLEKVRNALSSLQFCPFEIELSYAGAFPNFHCPRVLWISGQKGMKELTSLAESVNKSLVDIGLPHEKRSFKPHLTLARTKGNPLPPELITALQHAPTLRWHCKSFDLMRSNLTPRGPVYAKIPLLTK